MCMSTISVARHTSKKSSMSDDISRRVKLHGVKILSGNYYTLRLASFDFLRGDGVWQHQERESYDIGDAAAVLPLNRARDRVLLIKQFRWPLFEWGYRQLLIEVIAGKLDGDTPLDCINKEAMEEAGVTISSPRLLSRVFCQSRRGEGTGVAVPGRL